MGLHIDLDDDMLFYENEDGDYIPVGYITFLEDDEDNVESCEYDCFGCPEFRKCCGELEDEYCPDCGYDYDGIYEEELDEIFSHPVTAIKWLIKDVIFNDPATIVLWWDGTKTVVKCCEGDTYNKEFGLMACIIKKFTGNDGRWNEIIKDWCTDEV